MFVKIGESTGISRIEDDSYGETLVTADMLAEMTKTANALKKIAPRADGFLYFSAVMMHAAEASAINPDGTPKLTKDGSPVKVGWDTSNGTLKWVTNDPSIKPYKNKNLDSFPSHELIKAHKQWVGKPLCIDHKSSSVDHVRGFIVDTYYDHLLHRVVALCALDKVNYPDLAHAVKTGYKNDVSMGVGVGRAICSDCGRVAKVEADFCDHMRYKTCYAEINADLNPIELSIVVNGADSNAKIKHVIAAAKNLGDYLDVKDKELEEKGKDFPTSFSADVSISTGNEFANGTEKKSIQTNDVNHFISEMEKVIDGLKRVESESGNKMSSDVDNNDVSASPSENILQSPATEKFASVDLIKELHTVTATLEAKLNIMKDHLNQLNSSKEGIMSNNKLNKSAYFNGGGGVNEPTPGQRKYPVDDLNEDDRVNEDKHMHADDIGDVTGLHPGVKSVKMDELDRKRMLARAQSEERAERRKQALDLAKQALDKNSYWQGGGGVNEPTPGKTKYQPDPGEKKARDLDKQMVGQKPFPGTGDVEGMHPGVASAKEDELKRKQKMLRAGLTAKFLKGASLGESAWEVYDGSNLVLRASVNQLSGNLSDLMYDKIATQEFGQGLIQKIRKEGASHVNQMIKSAQAADPAAAPAPEAAAMPAMPAMPDMGGMADMGAPADETSSGDPKENAVKLATQMRDLSSDLLEAVKALVGEKAEMGEASAEMPAEAPKTASNLSYLKNMRRELNSELTKAMKQCLAELRDQHEELEVIANMSHKGLIKAANYHVVEDSFTATKESIAEGLKLIEAFVKYARGTIALEKRAQEESIINDMGPASDFNNEDSEPSLGDSELDLESLDKLQDMSADDNDAKSKGKKEPKKGDDMDVTKALEANDSVLDELDALLADDEMSAEEGSDDNDAKLVLKDENGAETEVKVTAGDLSTKSGRAAYRAKLAGKSVEMSDMLGKAHPKGSHRIEGLDTKTNEAVFEDLEDAHDRMLDVATAPVKVRKEAEAINRLVSEGKLDVSDLDALVAEGLDKEAVAYYKKYFGQVDKGSEFASELVKEHAKAQLEEDKQSYRVKLSRAYKLANEMVSRGLCNDDEDAVTAQVDEIMKFNDESFNSLKRVVAKQSPLFKSAGVLPQVGMQFGGGESASSRLESETLAEQLTTAFAGSKGRLF